ncbi:hypothetical protein LCGC14_1313020, partial [marine sediment metagenome]
MLSRKDVERFWASVDRSGGDDSCWEWQRGKTSAGYGEFGANRTTLYTHRVAFELSTGAPAPHYVCHTCDNPPCCNPAHLFAGTCQDYVNDKVRKGRQLRGEQAVSAVLTELDVLAMRVDYVTNRTSYSVLAERFGVDKETIG